MNVVVTGASRGIGLELVRQYLARGDVVFAAVRTPGGASELDGLARAADGRLRIGACDVAIDASVQGFAQGVTEAIDVLVNNAGVRSEADDLGTLDLPSANRIIETNAIGALRVALALLPQLRRAGRAKIANISSALGSIGGNNTGGSYGYRMSKAALNMATRSLAQDLRAENIIAVALSPGWVKTDMGGADAPTEVTASAAGLISVIDRVTFEDSGAFLNFLGERVAW
jgi:NAD(P)-dependent dehydrogenase (short-subunit alcohol dehydrogenase family)